MAFEFVNAENFAYLTQNLTLGRKDIEVLDHALRELDRVTGVPSQIVSHSHKNGFNAGHIPDGAQFIISMDKFINSGGRTLQMSKVLRHKSDKSLPPALHINLQSPTLDIPQRVEIPLRYVMKGLLPLKNLYMVYLHALKINDSQDFVYYGITKRGWMKRFNEHVQSALKEKADRKFSNLLHDSIVNRANELYSTTQTGLGDKMRLTGSYHVVCTAGRSKSDAHNVEKYLIDKYSLKNPIGLNMVAGKNISEQCDL